MEKKKKKKSTSLSALMLKAEFYKNDFKSHLVKDVELTEYTISSVLNIDGKLFIKKKSEKEPKWLSLLQDITTEEIDALKNTSSSAVLIIRNKTNVFAFTFGYGRFLINDGRFMQDFGIVTALNTLNHESLRSIDINTFDDQPIQKRAQVTKASNINTFGIDISKDILRTVTGMQHQNVLFRNISGGDAVYSFTTDMVIEDIMFISEKLVNYYNDIKYKTSFAWVDNIKRVKIKKDIDNYDEILFEKLKNRDTDITVHIPEIIDWNEVLGFSFTRSKDKIQTLLDINNYYLNNADEYNINMMQNDQVFVFQTNDITKNYSLYKSIYFEISDDKETFILFTGTWYVIKNTFMGRINDILDKINYTTLSFPTVYESAYLSTQSKQPKLKLEREDNYNIRTAKHYNYYLLDKKLVKTNRTTTSIELCDLLTKDKQLIHVKHKKGGSAGLSHLFAQGNVSAEILLGDRDFRLEARKVLRKVNKDIDYLIPIDNLKSNEYEIIYLILGQEQFDLKEKLPFFSKVNLTKAYENLTQKGFKVSIGSVVKERK